MLTKREIRLIAEELANLLRQKEEESDKLITAIQASELCGLSVKSLYNRKNEIGYVKMGNSLMFNEANIKAYAQSRIK